MDLSINIEEYRLNIRAAAVIIHNNKILVHRNMKSDHYALIGGRVEIGEPSDETVKREILEETGKKIEITGYIGTIENFFEMKGPKYHEIMFVHQVEFIDKKDKEIQTTLTNVEGKDYLQYEWIDINKIQEYKILPETIKGILKEGKFPIHKINIDE